MRLLRRKYKFQNSQRGFTLMETVIVLAISAALLTGLYYTVTEGLNITVETFKSQDSQRSQNNCLLRFGEDIRSAVFFYAGTTMDPNTGSQVLDTTPMAREITFSILRNDGSLAWVKYELLHGVLTSDTYVIRLSDFEDPTKLALTYVSHDVSDFELRYFDADGLETDNLGLVSSIELTLTTDSGGITTQRVSTTYKLRNTNRGLAIPPWDFDGERDSQIVK